MLRKQFSDNGLWDDNAGDLLICSPDNRILGKISFYKTRGYVNAVEVGYILYDVAGRGKGVMTEALTLFVEYLFFSKGINRIELTAAVENAASRRVAEKCGFTLEGIMRCALISSREGSRSRFVCSNAGRRSSSEVCQQRSVAFAPRSHPRREQVRTSATIIQDDLDDCTDGDLANLCAPG